MENIIAKYYTADKIYNQLTRRSRYAILMRVSVYFTIYIYMIIKNSV